MEVKVKLDQIKIRIDIIQAAIGHLDDYIYHKTECRMNYARSSANVVKGILEKALEENNALDTNL